ncbi:MAG TPA: DUF2318 domain-containing protein [Firmicutes bacterium]|nr:DUF2318 domain-containing protein [Bacillota bacterium]
MSKWDEKRERVLGGKGMGKKGGGAKTAGAKLVFPALFLVAVAGLVVVGVVRNTSRPSGPSVTGAQVGAVSYGARERIEQVPIQVAQADGKIEVPLSEVKEKRLVGFTYNGAGKTLPLLAYVAPSGKVVTAVSLCEPCNSTTFHIEGNELVCNTCGTRWELENLRGTAGGCQAYPPDPFPNTLAGETIVVQETAVAGWQRRV